MQGNRGKQLEREVNKLFKLYDNRGIHCQQNHPEQLTDGTFVKRHGYDFHLMYKNKFIVFDAKECHSNTFHIETNLKPHQLNAMKKVVNNGGEAFFMIFFFNEKKLIRLDVEEVLRLIKEGRLSVTAEDGISIKLNFLNIK